MFHAFGICQGADANQFGGTNEVAETRLGPVSTHFLEAVSAASPILRLSPAGSPYKPVTPVERRLSPPAAAEEPMLGPTTRSRHATIEAMAAHGKTKSGAKKKRQATKRKKARSAAEAKPDIISSAGGSEGADVLTRASERLWQMPSPHRVRNPCASRTLKSRKPRMRAM